MKRTEKTMSKIVSSIKYWLMVVCGVIEACVAVITLAALCVAAVTLVQELTQSSFTAFTAESFKKFLADALVLIIGIEFIKMLIKHTPGAAIEVLLYAIIREMIVYHTNTYETCMGVLAIAGLFAVKKFLFVPRFEDRPHRDRKSGEEQDSAPDL